MSRVPPLLLLVCVSAACAESELVTAPATPVKSEAPAMLAYLSLSDSNVSVGANVVAAGDVALSVSGEGVGVGSFTARVRFDPAALAFVGDVAGAGMMRAVNATAGEVVIAGASGSAVANPRLFAVRFRVLRSGGTASLALDVSEMNNGRFESQLPSLRVGAARVDRALK